jgi:hypothetical protein
VITVHTEYTVSLLHGRGWVVLRNGDPIGRRSELFDAVSFATHLAEREATVSSLRTRVSVGTADLSSMLQSSLLRRVA